MRQSVGQALPELVVAVALSGIMVLLLSGMMSQALALSTLGQNDLIATAVAEELLENARVIRYDEITALIAAGAITQNVQMTFLMNADGGLSPTALRPTSAPLQLDLTSPSLVYGAVSPANPGIVNSGNKWVPGFGNYFRGTATEIVTQPSLGVYQITVIVNYNGAFGVSSGAQNTKTISRTAFVYQYGPSFP